MKRRAALAKTPAPKRQKTRSQLAMTQEIVRQEIRKNTDWKYTDHGLAAQNVTSAGTVVPLLLNLVRGDGGTDNFEGNVVNPQALTLKYYAHTSELRNVVRVMIIQWFDAAVPIPAGILQNVALNFGPISPTLVTNKEFIKVLYDKTHQMAPTSSDGAGAINGEGIIDPVTVYIPGKRLKPVRYQSGANVVQDGALYILYISDDLLVPSPQITFYSRVTFSDK